MQTHTHIVTHTNAGHKNTIACLPAGGPVRRKQPNKTNNKKKKRVNQEKQWLKREKELVHEREGCEQAGGSRRKFGFDKHHISHSEESLLTPPPRKKYNQKNIEAVILQTSVSFLPHEGQLAV